MHLGFRDTSTISTQLHSHFLEFAHIQDSDLRTFLPLRTSGTAVAIYGFVCLHVWEHFGGTSAHTIFCAFFAVYLCRRWGEDVRGRVMVVHEGHGVAVGQKRVIDE
jgi:hypothetical protein